MARKSRTQAGRSKKHRASWRGQLTFGLVSFAVEAFNAFDREHSGIHFHQLHAGCNRRIQYQKVCPVHGQVSNDEIVSGYEIKKGKYVEIDPEELESLRTENDRALKIDAFVSPETVDPIYFDGRMYYLLPADSGSQEPYAVIVEAMEREERCGLGQVVFSGKDQIALVRPLDGLLHMAMLNYEAEIRSPKKVAQGLKKPKGLARQVHLAQTLVEQWSQEHFDLSHYHDTYRARVKELIEAKKHGREISPPPEEEPAGIVNLMDALKKSLHAVRAKAHNTGKKASRRRSA